MSNNQQLAQAIAQALAAALPGALAQALESAAPAQAAPTASPFPWRVSRSSFGDEVAQVSDVIDEDDNVIAENVPHEDAKLFADAWRLLGIREALQRVRDEVARGGLIYSMPPALRTAYQDLIRAAGE